MKQKLNQIAQAFALEGQITTIEPLGEGFINDTFVVKTANDGPSYILQRKNKSVFRNVPAMMENICKVTNHIRRRAEKDGCDPERATLRVISAHDGKPYWMDQEEEFWAVCLFIPQTVAYEVANTTDLARKGGEGIGRFQAQLADFTEPLADTIPGFHNIRHRFEQWDATLAADKAQRKSTLATEIDWIESRREKMLGFWAKVENGTLPMRVTHNDTKISNILFTTEGEVLCAIDLDTVMNSTSLNDFGDAIRSYANTAAEDEKDLSKIAISLEMFAAYTDGYLSQRAKQLNQAEIDNLAFSALYITYEQVLRFLMDYIDGDNYYKTKYDGHNLVRTHAQERLLESMEQNYDQMCQIVKQTCEKYL